MRSTTNLRQTAMALGVVLAVAGCERYPGEHTHRAGEVVGGELADAQIPASVTRDVELADHAGDEGAHHDRYTDAEAEAAMLAAESALTEQLDDHYAGVAHTHSRRVRVDIPAKALGLTDSYGSGHTNSSLGGLTTIGLYPTWANAGDDHRYSYFRVSARLPDDLQGTELTLGFVYALDAADPDVIRFANWVGCAALGEEAPSDNLVTNTEDQYKYPVARVLAEHTVVVDDARVAPGSVCFAQWESRLLSPVTTMHIVNAFVEYTVE